jgi:hypothetical protein
VRSERGNLVHTHHSSQRSFVCASNCFSVRSLSVHSVDMNEMLLMDDGRHIDSIEGANTQAAQASS